MSDSKEKIIIEDEAAQLEEAKHKESVRVLAFSLDKDYYCIEIIDTKEVFTPGSVTRVPNVPAFIKGVTNLHGLIIPLIDIRPFLGLAVGELTQTSKAIVAEVTNGLVGIVVDKIFEAKEIEKDLIQPPLATLKGKVLDFTKGQITTGNEIMAFLDLEKILGSKELLKE